MQMNELYQKAIQGTLSPTPGDPLPSTLVYNMLPMPLTVYAIERRRLGFGPEGVPTLGAPGLRLNPYVPKEMNYGKIRPRSNSYLLFENPLSQAFVGVIPVHAEDREFRITSWYLLDPNNVGSVPRPAPEAGIIIADDPPPMVVGCGSLPKPGNVQGSPYVAIREQYWQRIPESYTIAPGERKDYSLDVTSGMQSETSTESTLEAAVSAGAGGGWGPISASVSASLSASSTSFQQVSLSEETRSYVSVSRELPQDHQRALMVEYWQLMDRVTITDGATTPGQQLLGSVVGSIVTATQPTVINATEITYDTPQQGG